MGGLFYQANSDHSKQDRKDFLLALTQGSRHHQDPAVCLAEDSVVQGQFYVSFLHTLQEKLFLVQTLQTEQTTLAKPTSCIAQNTSSTAYRQD